MTNKAKTSDPAPAVDPVDDVRKMSVTCAEVNLQYPNIKSIEVVTTVGGIARAVITKF